jgi:hypothetical protein
MPGPNSRPNGTKRDTEQLIPPKLAARIAEWEKQGGEHPAKSKTKHHKPGSQK